MKTKHLKEKLEAEKAKLESALEKIGRRNPLVPGDWEAAPLEADMESDLADQADIVMNRENNASILADLEARYDTIIGALLRFEKKTYGVCEVCGAAIAEERLEADPTATTCTLHL